jgi:TusA-related sulfurtransferase
VAWVLGEIGRNFESAFYLLKSRIMERQVLDTSGLKYPNQILEVATKASEMRPGELLEIIGDGQTFEKIVLDWCGRLGKDVLAVQKDGGERRRIWITV